MKRGRLILAGLAALALPAGAGAQAIDLPPLPPPEDRPPVLSQQPALFLRAVRFEGNTVIPDAELAEIAAPFVGRPVTAEDLQELRYRLSARYVERGYINSGAVLPDQEVADGVVTYRIVEGGLSAITVTGSGGLVEDYVADRLRLGAGPPLDVDALRDRIQILLQDPLIDRLNAELRPGLAPGDSVLDVAVTRARPYGLALSLDNHATPSVGALRGRIEGVARNLTGHGDALDLRVGRTGGSWEASAGFALPVSRYDTTVTARFEFDGAAVIEEPLADLDIRSRTRGIELGVRQPVFRTPSRHLDLGLTLTRRHSETTLFGRPFTFSPGERDGESDVTVLRLVQDWLSRSPEQVVAARSTLSFGLNALNATANPGDVPDGQFAAWLGQFQWARRLTEGGSQVLFRTDLQLAGDRLLPVERFALGGAESVRGYVQNAVVRDNGVAASLEGRFTLFRLPVPGLSQQADDGQVQFAPFLDFGHGWNRSRGDSAGPETLIGVGAGLRWEPSEGVQAQLYYGHPLRDVEGADGNGLQERGVYFRLVARLS